MDNAVIINDTLRRIRIENGAYPFIVTPRFRLNEISAAAKWCSMQGTIGVNWDYRAPRMLMSDDNEIKFYFDDEATAVEFKLLFG